MTPLLDGIRVLEVAVLFNGDLVGQHLGDLGADVIKIESPGRGDYLRDMLGQIAPHQSPAHLQVNRNKRSLTLDVRTDAGREVFWKLFETADIFVDGLLSGACDRMGIGYAEQRRRKPSIYQTQLRAKQTAKRYYGVREKQFRIYVDKANRASGVTGEELLRLLERRLDNVVYRLGFAGTRAQARQFVNHGHVLVNGKKVDIASYLVTPGESIKIKDKVRESASQATELTGSVAGWLQTDFDALEGKVLRLPERMDINAPVNEQLDPAKASPPEDVGDGLALEGPASHELLKAPPGRLAP